MRSTPTARPPLPRLGIMRRHQRTQLAPRHHLLHLFQKYRSPRLPRVLLKAGHHRQSPLFHLSDTLTCQLWKAESLIRVSLVGGAIVLAPLVTILVAPATAPNCSR